MNKQKRIKIHHNQIIKIKEIIQNIENDTNCHDFLFAVNWKAFKLFDYPKIIKKPMFINKVKKNIDQNIYKSIIDIYNDIQLIWRNCKVFNLDDSVYFSLLFRIFLKKLIIWKKFLRNYFQI